MKHGKNPSREQRKLIQSVGLDSHEWLVIKDTSTELVLVDRKNDQITKSISKAVNRK